MTSTSRLGALFVFNTTTVTSRVGVSFISTAQACQNLDAQIPAGTTREELTSQTKEAWNTQVLSKITTTDTNTTNKALLYTSLYQMNIIPTNKTGENPLWTSTEPYYDDIFTLWDLVSLSNVPRTTRIYLPILPIWDSSAVAQPSSTSSSPTPTRSTSAP